jgi:tetratricopeptide (TPR) repeat protein
LEILLQSLRAVGFYQRTGDHAQIVNYARKLLPREASAFTLPHLLGFVAAVAREINVQEFEFHALIQAANSSPIDIPHLLHFTDELQLMTIGVESGFPLLELNFMDVKPLMIAFSKRYHLIPEIRLYPAPPIVLPRDYEEMRREADRAAEALPELTPVGDGNRIGPDELRAYGAAVRGRGRGTAKSRPRAPGKPQGDVVALIQRGKHAQAYVVATEALAKAPDDWEMYIHRAFCQLLLEKYADGIIDCNRSLEIKRTEKAFRLRAALWLKLGDREMSDRDLREFQPPARATGRSRGFPDSMEPKMVPLSMKGSGKKGG